MSDDPRGPGRADDTTASPDTGSGRETDIGGSHSGGAAGDRPGRGYGSVTPGEGRAGTEGDAITADTDKDPEKTGGVTEGVPEDLRLGGERPGLDEDEGADAADHGRETAP